MFLFISFLIGTQIVHILAASISPSFDYPSCNSLVVKAAAEAALDQINSNRKEGYVLGLQRIFDVRKLPQGDESDFDFLLDVLETKCHVRSWKPWKECEFREPYETVFGHCTISMRFKSQINDYVLHRYNCFLRPYYPPFCHRCPNCRDPSEDSIQELAKECLDKFNEETKHHKDFAIVEVTKASSQVIFAIFMMTVEFIIQETSCPKDPPDPTQCPFLPYEIAEAALCKGTMTHRLGSFPKDVSVHCDFFPDWLPHNIIETPPQQKGEVVQVASCAWRNREYGPVFPFPEEEANTTISNNPRGVIHNNKSPGCPGKVAKEIRGLHLPSYSWQQVDFS